MGPDFSVVHYEPYRGLPRVVPWCASLYVQLCTSPYAHPTGENMCAGRAALHGSHLGNCVQDFKLTWATPRKHVLDHVVHTADTRHVLLKFSR